VSQGAVGPVREYLFHLGVVAMVLLGPVVVNEESARTTTVAVHPVTRAVVTASVASDAAPRAEFALPPRSRVAAITGAASGVLMVAASAFRPRTSRLLPRSWYGRTPRPASYALQVRVHPAPVSDGHPLASQRGQARPLG
jgi:hypothetical protein